MNETGDYHLLDMCRSLNKTGQDLFEQVVARVEQAPHPDLIRKKVRFLMSDQGKKLLSLSKSLKLAGSVAVNAAKRIAAHLNADRTGNKVTIMYCHMHLG